MEKYQVQATMCGETFHKLWLPPPDRFVGWLLLPLIELVVDIPPRVRKSASVVNVVKETAIICSK